MLYRVNEVVSIIEVILDSDTDARPSQNLPAFLSLYKKLNKSDPELIVFNVAKLTVIELSDFGFEGEIIGGTECSTGQSATCSKKGYWTVGDREYFDYEFFKTTFKSVLDINAIMNLNVLLRCYRKPTVTSDE